MEQSPSWKAYISSANQEISCFLGNPNAHYLFHNIPPPVQILSQINPFHATPTYLSTIHFNIILLSMSRSFKWPLSLMIPPSQKTLYALHYSPIEVTFPNHPFHLNKTKCAYLYEFINTCLECLTCQSDLLNNKTGLISAQTKRSVCFSFVVCEWWRSEGYSWLNIVQVWKCARWVMFVRQVGLHLKWSLTSLDLIESWNCWILNLKILHYRLSWNLTSGFEMLLAQGLSNAEKETLIEIPQGRWSSKGSTFSSPSVFTCLMWSWDKHKLFSLNSNGRCVFHEAGTECLSII
jgi:hypothetical protein